MTKSAAATSRPRIEQHAVAARGSRRTRSAQPVAITASVAMAATVIAVPSPITKVASDAGPEQALRQREHQHQDRARAGPQPDRDDRRQAALPAARPGQFLGSGAWAWPQAERVVATRMIVTMVVMIVVGMRA